MRWIAVLFAVTMLAAAPATWAQEHAACGEPARSAAVRDSTQLRKMAAACDNPAISALYYNRAAHLELLAEAHVMSGLIAFRPSSSNSSLLSYRIYIAMIEALAPVWFPRVEERIAFLNAEYERRSEIARLRLRGYDPLANRLERQSGALPLPTSVD